MRHIIDAIAAQGRNGDDELLHVTKGEMAGLDALARRHFGRSLPRNPRTGLKEASLFRDWFGNDVGQVLDVAAPVATAFIPGVGPVAAAAMGAGLGAANQGLGKGGTTETALMGGVMGGIGAYGGSGLAEGLAGSATAAAPTATTGLTPTATAGANLGTGTIADVAANLPGTATMPAVDVATTALPGGAAGETLASTNVMAQPSGATGLTAPTTNAGTGLKLGTDTAGSTNVLNSATNTSTGGGSSLQATAPNGAQINSIGGGTSQPTNWDFLTTKAALGPVTQIGTSAVGAASIPSGTTSTDSTLPGVNKTLPKAEVYYTPYGERRTRIAAAEGGLMGLNGSYGDYDGAEDGVGDRRYAGGGGIDMVRQMQPGGAWGNLTADAYGVMHENMPGFINDATPGGFLGATTPGKVDYLDKKAAEEQQKKSEQEAGIAAALKARQDQETSDYWKQRYGMAEGGIANISAAKGRYLQGPGDGMSDSIPARIDGKQEARLASGEYVVSADVVSGLGNGDSTAGAKRLNEMMERVRLERTGTKKQGKQINPRKVMPA